MFWRRRSFELHVDRVLMGRFGTYDDALEAGHEYDEYCKCWTVGQRIGGRLFNLAMHFREWGTDTRASVQEVVMNKAAMSDREHEAMVAACDRWSPRNGFQGAPNPWTERNGFFKGWEEARKFYLAERGNVGSHRST